MNLPFKFSYTMDEKEIYEAFIEAGIFKTYGKRKYIYCAIFALCGFINALACFISDKATGVTVFAAVICFAMIGVICFLPEHEMRKRAKNNVIKNPIPVAVGEDKITIADGEKQWSILFDEAFRLKESQNFLIVYSNAGKIAAFPKKDIDATVLPELTEFLKGKAE